jgi:hypothetical protein
VLAVDLTIANLGFAAPFNQRPVYLVLTGGGERRTVRLSGADPRRWEPGDPVTLSARVRVPAGAAPGLYRLSLWLPDDASALRGDPRYAIRLANDAVWDEETGENVLVRDLPIDPAAGGAVDPDADELAEM